MVLEICLMPRKLKLENRIHGAGGIVDKHLGAVYVEKHWWDHLGGDPSFVADCLESGYDRRPIDVARKEVTEAIRTANIPAVVFEIHPLDTPFEDFNPMLGVASGKHVADIEVRTYPIAPEGINEIAHLQRAEQKFVPDVF